MTEFHDWDDIRAELDDGDRDALAPSGRAPRRGPMPSTWLRNASAWA
jgi:hypothetical protein